MTLEPKIMYSEEHKIQGNAPPAPWSKHGITDWAAKLRPLSDIRETTEPSLIDMASRVSDIFNTRSQAAAMHTDPHEQPYCRTRPTRSSSQRNARQKTHVISKLDQSYSNHALDVDAHSDQSSAYSLSLENVPPRSSSKHRLDAFIVSKDPKTPTARRTPEMDRTCSCQPLLSSSSVQDLQEQKNSSSHVMRSNIKDNSHTYARHEHPNIDILDFPVYYHPNISAELRISSPLYIGGGSIDGTVRIIVHELDRVRHKRQLAISRLSLDLIGFEEASGSRRHVFLNLASELIDHDHPPPHGMVDSVKEGSAIDPYWLLKPSTSTLGFALKLPMDVGPPSFHSRRARIRYVLATTILIRYQSKHYLVRSSLEVAILPVHDHKALQPLSRPLIVSDECIRQRVPYQSINATAKLHRQVWVSGTSIFVDVCIENNSKKGIKRLELQLERNILYYNHAAPDVDSYPRVFDVNDKSILAKHIIKACPNSAWVGIDAKSSHIRTFDLELPRGCATVRCGKFFQVRYFLNIAVGSVSRHKIVVLQLPIVLIHINSLDMLPKAIKEEQKPGVMSTACEHHHPLYAIELPETSSAASPDMSKDTQAHLADIGKVLEGSPRKFQLSKSHHGRLPMSTGPINDDWAVGPSPNQRNPVGNEYVDSKADICRPATILSSPRLGLSERRNKDYGNRAASIRTHASFASLISASASKRVKAIRPRKMHSSKLLGSKSSLTISAPVINRRSNSDRRTSNEHLSSPTALTTPFVVNSNGDTSRPFRKMKSAELWRYPGDWIKERRLPKGGSGWL